MSDAVKHKQISRLLVYGEMVRSEQGPMVRRWPSIRDVSDRFGVPKSTIGDLVKRHNLFGQRLLFERKLASQSGYDDDQAINAGEAAIWARIEMLLVYGELVDIEGTLQRTFPSCEDLAVRFDLHPHEVYQWAASQACYDRRETYLERVEDVFDQAGKSELKVLKQRIQARALQTTMALLDQAYEAATSRNLLLKASDVTRLLADVRHLRLDQHQGATSIEDVVTFLQDQMKRAKGDDSSPEERGEVLHLTAGGRPGHPNDGEDDGTRH